MDLLIQPNRFVINMQHHRRCANFLMIVFIIMNIPNLQHRVFYDDYSMNVFYIVIVLMVQLGTSCSFDSPGLARNEPTPGQRSQGDSTPSVLSFFCEITLTMNSFMADNAEKAQHLRRCSPHNIH